MQSHTAHTHNEVSASYTVNTMTIYNDCLTHLLADNEQTTYKYAEGHLIHRRNKGAPLIRAFPLFPPIQRCIRTNSEAWAASPIGHLGELSPPVFPPCEQVQYFLKGIEQDIVLFKSAFKEYLTFAPK